MTTYTLTQSGSIIDAELQRVPFKLSYYAQANSYTSGEYALIGSQPAMANSDIPSGTTFAWGASGATWSPVLPAGYSWAGVYANSTAYTAGQAFALTTSITSPVVIVTTGFTSSASGYMADLYTAGGVGVPCVVSMESQWSTEANSAFIMVGATSTKAGSSGYPPAPAAGQQAAILCGDGRWNATGKEPYIVLSNFSASGSLTASTSVDIAAVVVIPQTTAGVTITLPTPTVTTDSRMLIIINTGSAQFIAHKSTVISPLHYAEFRWSVAAQSWIGPSNDAMAYASSASYRIGDKVLIGGGVAYANADIPANTSFTWGTTGQTWSLLVPDDSVTRYSWKGVYANSTSYVAGDVIVSGSAINFVIMRVATAFTSGTSGSSELATGGAYASYVEPISVGIVRLNNSMWAQAGCTSSLTGRGGVTATPSAGYQDATWTGGSDWDRTGRGTLLAMTNQTASITLTASSTVDVCEYIDLNQTTASITLTLPTPSSSKSRRLQITNYGTASVSIVGAATYTIAAAGSSAFVWSPTASKWYKLV